MIWSVVSKEEMEGYGTSPVFRFYREALGKENVRLAIVEENDALSFVSKDDTVLLRTASPILISTIHNRRLKSTSETPELYNLVNDKEVLAEALTAQGFLCPRQYYKDELRVGKTYFVKPRFGSDSMGISSASICTSKEQVLSQYAIIRNTMHQDAVIEDYIPGKDLTVACVMGGDILNVASIGIDCDETYGIQTRDCKVGFKEYCSLLSYEESSIVEDIAKKIVHKLCIKHHARIDFRKGEDGRYYLIDVNLLPGLGPIDHFAKAFLLSKNRSYVDVIKMIVNSAY